jgi:ribosomal protein S9
VLLRELFRLLEAAARRHGENHFAGGGVDAQCIASRLAMTAQAHEINRFVENDLNDRGLARTAIEQRAQRHGSTLEQPRRKYCHMSKRAQHDGQ